jgi:hypothetical protein
MNKLNIDLLIYIEEEIAATLRTLNTTYQTDAGRSLAEYIKGELYTLIRLKVKIKNLIEKPEPQLEDVVCVTSN